MTPRSGTVLGRYRLEEFLGRGGMAEVWRAYDTALDRSVAIKLILPALVAETSLRERFLREARLAAALDHPHVLPIFDLGETDEVPYVVMPLVSGGTLAERLAAGRPRRARAIAWVVQVASALDAAHQAGVLHRDVKPGNVLLGAGERALLADFGIARLAESTTRLTVTGMVVGTPAYMAPELARGESATPASDRYALAVLAWELLAGVPPYRGESALSVLHQHVSAPVPRLSVALDSAPLALDAALVEGLAKDPVRRPQSGRELAEALTAGLSNEEREELGEELVTGAITPPAGSRTTVAMVSPRSAPAGRVGGSETTVLDASSRPAAAGPTRSGGPRRLAVAAAVAAVLVAGLIGGLWVARSIGSSENEAGEEARAPVVPSTVPAPEIGADPNSVAGEPGQVVPAAPTPRPLSVTGSRASNLGARRFEPGPTIREGDPGDGGASERTSTPAPPGVLALRRGAELLRRPGRLLTAADFAELRQLAGAGPQPRGGGVPGGRRDLALALAEGGEALLAGDLDRARGAAVALAEAVDREPLAPAWLVVALAARQGVEATDALGLASLFGDPTGAGAGSAGRVGVAGRLSAAVLASHHGQPRLALELAESAWPSLEAPRTKTALAAFAAGEAGAARDLETVERWVERLLAEPAGREPLLLRGVADTVGSAGDQRGWSVAVLRQACEAGVSELCGPRHAGPADRPRPRRR